jgi:hypothetical protein
LEPLLHAFTLNSLGRDLGDIAAMPHRPLTDLRRRKGGPSRQPAPHQAPPRRPVIPLRQPKR